MTDPRFPDGNPVIWVLCDDRAGNRSQALGVAEALSARTGGLRFQVQDIAYNITAALPNVIMGATFMGVSTDTLVNLAPPWPDIAIAAGRRTAPIARNIKKLGEGHTFLVQLMNPGGETGEFDLLAVPRHDSLAKADNLFEMTGAPHRVTPARLAEERARWMDAFAALPGPRLALIVGGDTKRKDFSADMAAELGAKANAMAERAGGSLLVSTSRRTSEAAANAVLAQLSVPHTVFRWGDAGENPYFGYLSCADGVIVTGESVSMCSEACATPGPVYIYAPAKLMSFKHKKLVTELFDKGYARPLGETFETWTHPPLNAADEVAAEIVRRVGLQG